MGESLPGLPRVRWVSDPTSYEPFASFLCGGTAEYERELDDAVHELHNMAPEDAAEYGVRVATFDDPGDVVGLSVFIRRPLFSPQYDAGSVMLAALAVSGRYRGNRMPDGVSRIGAFLLADALARIDHEWGNPMPCVWGVVHRDNLTCRNMLARHGFWRLRAGGRGGPGRYAVHQRRDGFEWTHGFSNYIVQAVERDPSG